MTANQAIQFTISTVDKATATINRINNTVSKMVRPYENLAKSVKRFSQASGLTEMANKLDVVAKKAKATAASIGRMATPLLAIVGGGTLAGLGEMVVHWERIGAETERTSRMLGITADQLTNMRSAATLMGVSADSMTSGFRSFADTLQDAKWGRNQGAYAMLQALGITLHTTKTGAIDAQAAMYDLADRIQRLQKRDPAAARNLARSLGVEQLLPMLGLGSEGMRKYEAEARRLRGEFTPEMAARAQAFSTSLNMLGVASDGLRASIADRLAPIIQPVIDRMSDWISKNREWISQRVGEVVDHLAKMLDKVDWPTFINGFARAVDKAVDFAGWILKVIDKIGGLKTVLVAVGVYMAGGFVLSVGAAVVSIVALIGKIGLLIGKWKGAGAAARDAASTMNAASSAGGAAAGVSRAARAMGGLKAGLKGGAVLAGIVGAVELGGIAMSNESSQQKKRDASGAVGGTAGSIAGAALGGAIGSVLLPGIGTAIGMSLGGVAGDAIGRYIGNAAGRAMFGHAQGKQAAGTNSKQAQASGDDASSPGDKRSLAARVTDAADAFAKKISEAADDLVDRLGQLGGSIASGVSSTASGVVSGVMSTAGRFGRGVNDQVKSLASKLNFGGLEKQYGLQSGLLSAIAMQESGGNTNAVSPTGASGLFQFTGATAKQYGITNRFDPAQEAQGAAKYMHRLLDMFHGNLRLALSAYNGGEGNVMKYGPNFRAETANYAPQVLSRLPSLNSGEPVPSLNQRAQQVAPTAPEVHVHNQVHVARDGGVTVRTQTPSGLKIARPVASMVNA
ncbi:transglycosylase SLT domain-containing protein [Paraburkholderia sp. BR14263]|uniref:transglycosylase SLT domain-containing protein n=1 Tax=unclassified Paraburkholderia TaxID=2615204 RepID=UPI0034CFDBC2